MALPIWLIVGAAAGWIAGLAVKSAGFGIIGNILVGILGSIVAGLPWLGIAIGSGLIGAVIHATIYLPVDRASLKRAATQGKIRNRTRYGASKAIVEAEVWAGRVIRRCI